MNTRISKILSVLATVVIVAGSFAWAMPVSASTPGDGSFSIQDLPSGTGNVLLTNSQIQGIAVGSDGKTIYVIDTAGDQLFKSTDAGLTFDTIKNNYTNAAGGVAPVPMTVPTLIAVAPDDVNTVAVVDTLTAGVQHVILTKDGGTTWATLPDPPIGANGIITDIAVAPARSGTLLGREYVISIADQTAGTNGGARSVLATVLSPGWPASAGNYTVTYTNQDGVAGKVSGQFQIPASAATGATVTIPLASGDTGVTAVASVAVVQSPFPAIQATVVNATWSTTPGTYNVTFNGGSPSGSFTIPANSTVGTNVAIPSATGVMNVTAVGVVSPATAADRFNVTGTGATAITFLSVTDGSTGANTTVTSLSSSAAFSIDSVGSPTLQFSANVNGATGAGTFGGASASGTINGDVKIIGDKATWQSVGGLDANKISGVFDFTSVVVTPNFLSDRSVVAVGTKGAAGSTAVVVIGTQSGLVLNNPAAATVATGNVLRDTAGTTTDYAGTPAATSIISSTISLPTNFDASGSSTSFRSYVGIASKSTRSDNGLFRCDKTTAKVFDDFDGQAVFSVSFAGTIDAGNIFVGLTDDPVIKYSNVLTTTATFTDTLKEPTSAATTGINTLVAVASDFATSNTIFAGTLGAESGFNASTDGGVSFVARALVDTGSIATPLNVFDTDGPSLSFASDAKSVLMYGKDKNNYLTIWKSAVPFTSSSWYRLFAVKPSDAGNAAKGSIQTSGSAVYFGETGIANGKIYVSQDAGVSFPSTRGGPSNTDTLKTYALRDAQTVYYVNTAGVIFKSTNSAFGWGTGVNCGVGTTVNSLKLTKANQIMVSGTSGDLVAISNDDGATFNQMGTGLPGGNYSLQADSAYATSSIMFAADTTASVGKVWRVKTDVTTNAWEDMSPIGTNITGVTIKGITGRSGVLYVTNTNGVVRSLYPTDQVGNQNWHLINQGLPSVGAGVSTTAGINLYIKTGATPAQIYAFNDYLASTKPTLTAVDDNYADPIDPNTGYGMLVDLKIKPMGVGGGQVDEVEVEIVDKNTGLTGQNWDTFDVSASLPVVTTDVTSSNVPFQSDHSYLWRMRASHTTSGQSIDSPWSDTRTINVQSGGQVVQQQAGVILQGPQPGAMDVNPALVGFSWAPVSGATEYQIVIATDAALTKTVATTPAKVTTTSFQAAGLEYGTTYFWSVQATKPTTSQQSIGTFTTMAKPAATTGGGGGGTPAPPQTIIVQPTPAETPAYIWAVIAIGAILVIAVIILIVRTRRVP